jgi:hypothetical protein
MPTDRNHAAARQLACIRCRDLDPERIEWFVTAVGANAPSR